MDVLFLITFHYSIAIENKLNDSDKIILNLDV